MHYTQIDHLSVALLVCAMVDVLWLIFGYYTLFIVVYTGTTTLPFGMTRLSTCFMSTNRKWRRERLETDYDFNSFTTAIPIVYACTMILILLLINQVMHALASIVHKITIQFECNT